jgi:hypothetical protein
MTASMRTLYRPVGPAELVWVERSGMRAFPPRLPGQAFFYAVFDEGYAAQVAREVNAKESGEGIVTRFLVDADFVARYPVHLVDGRAHAELWIPAADLDELHRHLVGAIEVIARFAAPA